MLTTTVTTSLSTTITSSPEVISSVQRGQRRFKWKRDHRVNDQTTLSEEVNQQTTADQSKNESKERSVKRGNRHLDTPSNEKEKMRKIEANYEENVLAENTVKVLSKIDDTPRSTLSACILSNTNPIREKNISMITVSFNINSVVSDELCVETLLKTNQENAPDPKILWPRIRKIISSCYNRHVSIGKKSFSGEDMYVSALIDWLKSLIPTFSSSYTEIFEMAKHSLRKGETIRDELVENMSNFSLSFDGILKQEFEIASKLVDLLTNLYYSNLNYLIVNGLIEYATTSLFKRYAEKDTSIALTIRERITTIINNNNSITTLDYEPKLAKEFKNYSKLLACLYSQNQSDFRYFTLSMSQWPSFIKYALFKHLFSFATDEAKVCSFLVKYFQLPKQSSLENLLNNRIKNFDDIFDLGIVILILKASKKVRENSKDESSKVLQLSKKQFEICKKFVKNQSEGSNMSINQAKSEMLCGVSMIRKLKKYI